MVDIDPESGSKCDAGGRNGRTSVDMKADWVMGYSMFILVPLVKWWWSPNTKAAWKVASISMRE